MKSLKLITGLLLFFVDGLLVISFPFDYVLGSVEKLYYLIACLGIFVYLAVHLVQKPEKFYVWNHEISHLLASKLFMRDVTGFHITKKRGGKIVLDKTNFIIDLAPYMVYPLVITLLLLAVLLQRAGIGEATLVYFLLTGYFLCMMFAFTAESFLARQEDIRRNGLVFSASIIILGNFIFFPAYLLPGVWGKKIFLENLVSLWWKNLSLFLLHLREFAIAMYGVAEGVIKH